MENPSWACVNWETPQKCKRLIVAILCKFYVLNYSLKVSNFCEHHIASIFCKVCLPTPHLDLGFCCVWLA